MKYLKFMALFMALFLAMVLNLPDSFIARLGFEVNYLLAAGVSLLITWLSVHQNVLMVIVIVTLAVGAGLPEETATSIGYDRDVILAALFAVILVPTIRKFLDLD